MRARDTKARRQLLLWYALWQGIQDRADPTWFFGGSAMSLTRCTYGATAAVSDASRIDHTHCPIMLAAPLLRIERCPLRTTQGAIHLWEKVVSSQTSYPCHACPLWGTEGKFGHRRVRGWQCFSARGGKTR